jgi:hypothetical protein
MAEGRIGELRSTCQYDAGRTKRRMLFLVGPRVGSLLSALLSALVAALVAATGAASARAQQPPPSAAPPPLAVTLSESPEVPPPAAEVPPERPSSTYLEYGVACAAEFVADPGPACSTGPNGSYQANTCILGSGGGIVIPRIGWRRGPWYFGGAFELSKQDPNKLYRLALLKQLRAEARYYLLTSRVWQPFLGAGAGVAGYGDEVTIATLGPMGFLGAGIEAQPPNAPVVGVFLGYRPIYLERFDDGSGISRPPGVAHLVGLELTLQTQERL